MRSTRRKRNLPSPEGLSQTSLPGPFHLVYGVIHVRSVGATVRRRAVYVLHRGSCILQKEYHASCRESGFFLAGRLSSFSGVGLELSWSPWSVFMMEPSSSL